MANQVKLKIYLAGAIRDGHPEDVEWRERVIDVLNGKATILNPLAAKTYNTTTKTWNLCGIAPVASVIVPHDFYHVDHSDIVVFNFRALSEGYPNIGTLVEFGRATGVGCLVYTIVDPAYIGHVSTNTYLTLHPFLERNSAIVFPTVDDCVSFLEQYIDALTGENPHFGGYVG